MNQRIVFSIATQVAVDLFGHREMHAYRASMPVVASSRVPVRLDGNMRGTNRESTSPYFPLSLSQNTTAATFVVMLSSTPHAFFAWRTISVASELSRCKFSLPHFRLQRVLQELHLFFRCYFPSLLQGHCARLFAVLGSLPLFGRNAAN